MASSFDQDVAGAILEWGVFWRTANAKDRQAWAAANVRGNGGFDPWRATSLEKAHLLEVLRVGRDPADVRRRLDRAFLKLEIEHLIEPYRKDDNLTTTLREVTALGEELVREGSHVEYLGGLRTVVERWKPSVVKIYNPSDIGIGTGFLVGPSVIATADHIFDQLTRFEVQFEGGDVVPHAKVIRPAERKLDVALIELAAPAPQKPVKLTIDRSVLDEVVVLGYPPVPHTADAYLLANRGEVSADDVQLYSGHQTILVSCILRGGYSGGPVLNRRGQAVGLVSENLFKELSAEEKSLNEALGFAAVLPSEWIQDMLDGKIERQEA